MCGMCLGDSSAHPPFHFEITLQFMALCYFIKHVCGRGVLFIIITFCFAIGYAFEKKQNIDYFAKCIIISVYDLIKI
ncbi:MAG: hypothetical protein HW390_596 [Candidatus Brocadiaceae bacterium]|nr:hypothetical protein [Candidatus Brocadiaceae bacterium]